MNRRWYRPYLTYTLLAQADGLEEGRIQNRATPWRETVAIASGRQYTPVRMVTSTVLDYLIFSQLPKKNAKRMILTIIG